MTLIDCGCLCSKEIDEATYVFFVRDFPLYPYCFLFIIARWSAPY